VIDHPHAKLARIAWEAVAHSDTETLVRICREDLVWHAAGLGPRAGDYRGLEAVLDYLATLGEDTDRFDLRFEDVLVGEGRVAVLFHLSGQRGPKRIDSDYFLLFRIEQEHLAEIWAVPFDQLGIDEFWA
jgi:ketosteroid isomerase-like protein